MGQGSVYGMAAGGWCDQEAVAGPAINDTDDPGSPETGSFAVRRPRPLSLPALPEREIIAA